MTSIIIFGEPKPQPRHRHAKQGNYVKVYDPASQQKQDFAYSVQANAPKVLHSKAIRVDLRFYFSRPKSHFGTGRNSGKLKDSAPEFHVKKPDIDNLRKFVLDALNKIYWTDDSIICAGDTQKFYTDKPRTEIDIIPIEDNEE